LHKVYDGPRRGRSHQANSIPVRCTVISVESLIALRQIWGSVTIPAVTPTFSLTSRSATSPEVPRDTSTSHVPLGSHVIHPHAPSRTMPCDPISRPRWVRLQESPPHPSTPNTPDEPESSTDPQIDSAAMTEDLSILQGLLSGLPMSLWSTVPDITDGH